MPVPPMMPISTSLSVNLNLASRYKSSKTDLTVKSIRAFPLGNHLLLENKYKYEPELLCALIKSRRDLTKLFQGQSISREYECSGSKGQRASLSDIVVNLS